MRSTVTSLHPGLPDRATYPPPVQTGQGHRHDLLHRGRHHPDLAGTLTPRLVTNPGPRRTKIQRRHLSAAVHETS
jgi:hypothetical protein